MVMMGMFVYRSTMEMSTDENSDSLRGNVEDNYIGFKQTVRVSSLIYKSGQLFPKAFSLLSFWSKLKFVRMRVFGLRTNCGETKPGIFPQHLVVCPFLGVFKLQPLSTATAGG